MSNVWTTHTWNININWDDPVTAPQHRVWVIVVAATIGAAAHRYHPFRIEHLIINLKIYSERHINLTSSNLETGRLNMHRLIRHNFSWFVDLGFSFFIFFSFFFLSFSLFCTIILRIHKTICFSMSLLIMSDRSAFKRIWWSVQHNAIIIVIKRFTHLPLNTGRINFRPFFSSKSQLHNACRSLDLTITGTQPVGGFSQGATTPITIIFTHYNFQEQFPLKLEMVWKLQLLLL